MLLNLSQKVLIVWPPGKVSCYCCVVVARASCCVTNDVCQHETCNYASHLSANARSFLRDNEKREVHGETNLKLALVYFVEQCAVYLQ